jgi:cytochrome c oxidase subunit 2
MNVTSVDVDHGIKIAQFGVSEALTPGSTSRIEFVADKTGSFSFFCNVSCGAGHSSMAGTLIVN